MSNWLLEHIDEFNRRHDQLTEARFDRMTQVQTWLQAGPRKHLIEYAGQFHEVISDLSEKYQIPLAVTLGQQRDTVQLQVVSGDQVVLFGRILVGRTLKRDDDYWTCIQYPRFVAPDGGISSAHAGGYSDNFIGSHHDVIEMLRAALETQAVGFLPYDSDHNTQQLIAIGTRGNILAEVENLLWLGGNVLGKYSQMMLHAAREVFGSAVSMKGFAEDSILRFLVHEKYVTCVQFHAFTGRYGYTPFGNYVAYPVLPDGKEVSSCSGRISHQTPSEILAQSIAITSP